MTGDEFPVGLRAADIDFILQNDPEVTSFDRIEGATAMWKIVVTPSGGEPVEMIADNGINEIYFQVLIQIDSDYPATALEALQPYATVGLVMMNDQLWIRSAFFVDFSNMHALTNTTRIAALAYNAYRDGVRALAA